MGYSALALGTAIAVIGAMTPDTITAGPSKSVIVLRTHSTSVLSAGTRALVKILSSQLGGALHLLIDTTLCAGFACDAKWISRDLGVHAWGYTAHDILTQWEEVSQRDAWPDLNVDEPLGEGEDVNEPGMRIKHRCWLATRIAGQLVQSAKTSWPFARGEKHHLQYRTGSDTCDGPECEETLAHSAALSVSSTYLVHEPSIILWWRAHAFGTRAVIRADQHLWVLEDDILFAGRSPVPFFERFDRTSDADFVSLFCDLESGCRNARLRLKGSDASAGTPIYYMDDTRTRAPAEAIVGDGDTDTVHHWEHLVRFSPRLLDSLDSTLRNGTVRHGEKFASTYCHRAAWCTTADLRDAHPHAVSTTMRHDGAKYQLGLHLPSWFLPSDSSEWFHVPIDRRCELLLRWARDHHSRQADAVRGIEEQCTNLSARFRDSAKASNEFTMRRVHLAHDHAVRPVVKLLEVQNCSACCVRKMEWCCMQVSKWKHVLDNDWYDYRSSGTIAR